MPGDHSLRTAGLRLRPGAPPAQVRPGRKLGPVALDVASSHRAWLEPVREAYLDSGRTLGDLGDCIPLAKSKLSELLRGVGLYPRWETIHRLAAELGMPSWPLHRLWKQAALDAGKAPGWIDRSTQKTTVATARHWPPMEHGALRQLVEDDYRFYAQVFLGDRARDAAVHDTFAALWLHWGKALRSADVRCFAWSILRTTVMARATHRDGRPRWNTQHSTPSSCRPRPTRPPAPPRCRTSWGCSKRSAGFPTPSSTSWCCATCAASTTSEPPASSAFPWPRSGPTNAAPCATWTVP